MRGGISDEVDIYASFNHLLYNQYKNVNLTFYSICSLKNLSWGLLYPILTTFECVVRETYQNTFWV